MNRATLVLASALALAACQRELNLPSNFPPTVTSVAIVGLEAQAVASGLPVMGGELVALNGSGFPTVIEQLQVAISGTPAEVVKAETDRVVVRFPVLAGPGNVDVTVTTTDGFRTLTGAFRYDGPGQPQGVGTTDLQTAIAVGGVVPVQPAGVSGFSDLAIAYGGGDSALLVLPLGGVATTTVPLGLVPSSATARLSVEAGTGNLIVQVLALDEKGNVGLGQVTLSPAGAVVDKKDQQALASTVSPRNCHVPRVLFTKNGTPVGFWVRGVDGAPVVATIDLGASGTEYKPKGGITRPLAAEITGWAPWKNDLVVFASGNELWLYDASTQAAPTVLQAAGVNVSQRLVTGCTYSSVDLVRTVAVETSLASEALAVSYRAGGFERVALVDLLLGTVRRGVAGVPSTALALAPVTPYVSPSWRVLSADGGDLVRFSPAAGAPACGEDLVPDASLQLSASPFAALPGFASMGTFSSGTRVLSTTQDGDLVTVLPPSLTSPGAVFRFASYGRLSMSVAPIQLGGLSLQVPVAVAEHTLTTAGVGSLDTGSAQLVLALDASDHPLALGGSAYGRGAVWVRNPASGDVWDGALAYTGDFPPDGGTDATGKLAGGSSAITSFKMDTCQATAEMQVRASVPLAGNPDLVAQGPARSGAFGPAGVARFGPQPAPTYLVGGSTLTVLSDVDVASSCLAPTGALNTATCGGSSVDLGVTPLDVTLSAGDVTAAARSLDPACLTAGPGSACPAGDVICQRTSCDALPRLDLVPIQGGGAQVTVALPSAPVGVVADRAGGFLVTLPCTGGTTCFAQAPFDTLCAGRGDLPAAGALLHVAEDGTVDSCLAVNTGLAGALAVTPNGAEVWVAGPIGSPGNLLLTRLTLPRHVGTGKIELQHHAPVAGGQILGSAASVPGGFAASGVTFSPDGSKALVTVPGEFRIVLVE